VDAPCLVLNYPHGQLGFGWDKICQATAPALAGTYRAPTEKTAVRLERNSNLSRIKVSPIFAESRVTH